MYLTQGLHRAVQQCPERIATIEGDERWSYRQLAERVARLAAAMRRAGVEDGDRVALLSLNSNFCMEFFLAAWWAGAVAVPVNTRWAPVEMSFGLNDVGASLLFVERTFLSAAPYLKQECPSLNGNIVVVGEGDSQGFTSYAQFIDGVAPIEDRLRSGDDLACIVFSGGTTGTPKGVMLSHMNMWSSQIAGRAENAPLPLVITLMAPPLFHTAALGKLVAQVMLGGTSVMMPAFDVGELIRLIQQENVNDVMWVPSMVQMLLDHPDAAGADFSCLKRITYGAAPMPLALLERAQKVFTEAEFIQAYGMTETAPVISMNNWENHLPEAWASGRIRSAGKATMATQVRIVDEHDQELPRGQVGEIIVRGPNVMLGYWGRPEETAETLRGGWMHTGDGGYMDDDGYIYVVDRIKDMIVSGGENVYSAEIENVLMRHPAVSQCAVIGIPCSKWGEAVHAVVVLHPGSEADEALLQQHCRDSLAGYKVPKSVEFLEELPYSGPGKVLKFVLRQKYWNQPQTAADQQQSV